MLLVTNPDYEPLNIACVFTPPAEGNKDIEQLQDDLEQEKRDNQIDPSRKKMALSSIITQYNIKYGTNHSVYNFDDYYRDVQKRIKDQKYPNSVVPQDKKIDIVIVVDMLLTGFDSKYLNTLYVDKDLKFHSLIQAFSRTNRILNATKPYGNIICYRDLRNRVDEAITLFSGTDVEAEKKIWLVAPASEVIQEYHNAVQALVSTMNGHNLDCTPAEVGNLAGTEAKMDFIEAFKKVQALKTRLEQYTDLTPEQQEDIQKDLDDNTLRAFRGAYLETVKEVKSNLSQNSNPDDSKYKDYDFELVLFASTVIDYDYIMHLISLYTRPTQKQKMTKEQLLSILTSSTEVADEKEYISAYIDSLPLGTAMSDQEVKAGYQTFKEKMINETFATIAENYGVDKENLLTFVTETIRFARIDEDKLNELFASMGWKARKAAKESLMKELAPQFNRLASGRKIEGLSAYVIE